MEVFDIFDFILKGINHNYIKFCDGRFSFVVEKESLNEFEKRVSFLNIEFEKEFFDEGKVGFVFEVAK